MGKSLEEWKNNVLGRKFDLDNQSYDCVDVSKHWIEYLTGVGWQTSAGWGNAKDIYGYWSDRYLTKMPAGSAPQLGDIAVMDGSVGGGYGHTGVVIGISGNNITIAQQNTFTQQAVYTGVWNAYGSYIKYMRPKVAFTVGIAPTLAPDERVPAYAAKYRTAPNTGAALMKTDTIKEGLLTAGESYKFKGYVIGENVDGNDKWLVGFYSGGYVWSGAMTDVGLHDLHDITPAALAANQRQVAADVMNVRREPQLMPDNVVTQLQPGQVVTIEYWQRGSAVEGNDVWLKVSGSGFVHSSGFTNTTTTGFSEKAAPAPTTPTTPTPTPPAPTKPAYSFQKELDVVTEVDPAGEGNFQYGNFPEKPKKVVLHDFGTEGRDTFGSVKNSFNKDGYEVSAHFVVSGKTILQMVSLKDRAWHAGPNGNDFVGIEIDPAMDDDTVASVRKLWAALDKHYGYHLEGIEHNQIMATDCGDDVEIMDLDPELIPVVDGPTGTEPDTDEPVVVAPTPNPNTPDVVVEIKTVLVNVTVTFVQAFLGAWAATGFNLDKVVLAGAVGAAGSLVWNTILKPFLIKKGLLKQ